MKIIIYIALFMPFAVLQAQQSMPGGVRGVFIWEIAEPGKNGQAGFTTKLPGSGPSGFSVSGRQGSVNNNPALFFSRGPGTANSTLDLGRLNSFTMFTVCQEADTTAENIIVSLESDSTAEMVLTDRRLAVLDAFRYAGFDAGLRLSPKIYSYSQNRPADSSASSRRLQLGRPPRTQRLPASVYSGIIPEVIVFSRMLSPAERRQVESYLAIKYGISLHQEFPASYLNSRGEKIWDAELNHAFNGNIAGIGRDDLSGLHQYVSESTLTPGLLKIAARTRMKDNSFIIWGDNGKSLKFEETGGLKKLQRDWRLSAFKSSGDTIIILTDAMSIEEMYPLGEGDIFWLMADRSGTGKFPFRQTDFIPSEQLPAGGNIIRFNCVTADPDNSGSDAFSLLAAPRFFAKTSLLSPSCRELRSGMIQTEIAGGEPPFDLALRGVSDVSFRISARISERDHIFVGISQGEYLLTATDSGNRTWSEKIRVSNSASWQPLLAKSFNVPEGNELVLDASDGMPALDFAYSWTYPDGKRTTGPELTAGLPGIYLLSVTDGNNCNITREIRIKQSGRSVFRMTDLYPNPASGWFTARISLEKVQDADVVVTDVHGKVIRQAMFRNDSFYRYHDLIREPGIYFVTIISEKEKHTMKLVIP